MATSSSIASNFNGTPIAGGAFIWFNSVLKPHGLGSNPVTVQLQNSSIQFEVGSTSYSVSVPNATIVFSSSTTTATGSFDTTQNMWNIHAPSSGLAGNVFLDGAIFQVPSGGFPGGIKPVTWRGDFSSDTSGVTVQWQWAAAVYPAGDFSTDYNALGVKPVDDNKHSIYQNSDHAGTPENFKCSNCLPGGGTGGGGSNFTGSYSGTASVSFSGTHATFSVSSEAGVELIWTAVAAGPAGNSLTLEYIMPNGANPTLSIAVVNGVNIQVTLATDAYGDSLSTGGQIAALANSTPAVSALVTVTVVQGGFIEGAFAQQSFSGGQ
jgi:hypothetical protein